MSELQFRAQVTIWDEAVSVIAGLVDGEGRITSIAKHVLWEMEERAPNIPIGEATFRFTEQEARNLMTALWGAGIRPAEYKDTRAEVVRIEAHLQDMRTLVFKTHQPTAGDL